MTLLSTVVGRGATASRPASPTEGYLYYDTDLSQLLRYSGSDWEVCEPTAAGIDTDAIHDNVSGEIVAITEKATPVSGDVLVIEDSEDSNNKKRLQVGNLPGGTDAAAIHDDTASEIHAVTEKATPADEDELLIEDSADSYNKKRIQIGNLPAAAGDITGPASVTDNAIARWDGTTGNLLQESYPTIDDSGNVDLAGHELRDFSEQVVQANTGAAYEIDWSAATLFELTLTDSPTFTFANEAAGKAITLILIQDGTGSRTVTWPGAVDWASATAPTLSSGASDVDVITMICRNDGTTVLGFAAGLDMG